MSPTSAQMIVNVRVPLGVTPNGLLKALRRLLHEAELDDIEVAFMHDERGISPATVTAPDSRLIVHLVDAVEKVRGTPVDLGMCGGATDMRFYRRYGIPAAMYGPRSYPIFAAAPNEFIFVRDLITTAQVHATAAIDLLR